MSRSGPTMSSSTGYAPHLLPPGYGEGPCASVAPSEVGACSWTLAAAVMHGFEPNTARVRYGSADAWTALRCDPSCAGEYAWHYADPATAKEVVLCEATCERLRSDGVTGVRLEYPCTYADAL